MTPAVFRLLLLVPFWLAALYGSLQIHQLDLHLGHSICGPWGCGPPMEALIGYHSFWLALIVPGALFAAALMPRGVSRKFGVSLAILALLAAVGYVAYDVVSYSVAAKSTDYVLQRGFFSLVTAVDLPMIQAAAAGCLLLAILGRAKASSAMTDRETEPSVLAASADKTNPFQSSSV